MGAYLLIFLLAVSQSSCDTADKVNGKYVTFEFGEEAPKLLIPVTLQDSIPAKLVLDTGIGGSPFLDSALVSQHPSLAPEDIPSRESVSSSAWNPTYTTKSTSYYAPPLR